MKKKTPDGESVKNLIIMAGIISPTYLVGKSCLYQALQSRGLSKVIGVVGAGAMAALTAWSAYNIMPGIVEYGAQVIHDHVEIHMEKESDED